MDKSIIEECAFLSKYFNKIPSAQFYKLCCDIVPMSNAFFPYIKSKSKSYNEQLIELLIKKYEISYKEAVSYYEVLSNIEGGIETLKDICVGYGHTEKECKKLLEDK